MHLHEMGGELNVGASQEERSGGCVGGDLFTLFCLMIPTGVNKLDKLIIKTSLIREVTVQRETDFQIEGF